MKLQRKSIVVVLLLVLAFNLTATALSVQAFDPGTGKYLQIDILGDGYVIASKVKSGETWLFDSTHNMYKVGAGTVLLEPFAAEGYRFVEWEGDVNPDNTTKTEKYKIIVAVFEEITYTITASADLEGFIDPPGAIIVTYGADKTFTFGPLPDYQEDYHVSTVVIDGEPLGGFLTTYTFENVIEDHTIHVVLDPIGTVTVPASEEDGSFNVDQDATITIGPNSGGLIIGSSIIDAVITGTSIRLYNIDWGSIITIEGGVVIAFLIPAEIDPTDFDTLRIIHGDTWQAIYSDVNNDTVVDGTDVSIVANAIKYKIYVPLYDLNADGKLDQEDIHIINENKGTTLTDVTGPIIGEDPGPYYITTIPLFDNPNFRVGR